MSINYEKSFKKLVEQIKLEKKWAEEAKKNSDKDRLEAGDLSCMRKGLDLELGILGYGRSNYDRGMVCAYRSILELAELLEKGEFIFEE